MSFANDFYSDVDIKQNEAKNFVPERVSSFPYGAREGRIVYHLGLKNLYKCINDTIDTRDPAAWRVESFNVDDILVDQYGDVLSNQDGNVLLRSS